MSKFRKRVLLITVISNLSLLAVAAVYAYLTVKSGESGREIIPCFIKHNFLIYCPGCGGSRSVAALLSLDVLGSFIYYPAIPYTVGVLVFGDMMAVLSFIRDTKEPLSRITSKPFLVIPVIVIVNFLVRNILLFNGIDYLGDITRIIENNLI